MLWSYIDKTDKFSKVVIIHRAYSINSVAFLYTNDDFVRKGTQLFKLTAKKKLLEINLTKEEKDLASENRKTRMRVLKDTNAREGACI